MPQSDAKQQPIKLHVDGSIFVSDNARGVWRFMQRLIEQFALRDDIQVHLYMAEGRGQPPSFPSEVQLHFYQAAWPLPSVARKLLRPVRLFNPLEQHWADQRRQSVWSSISEGVYHASFCTTHPELTIPQLVTIQDLTFERFEDCFEPSLHRRHAQEKADCVAAAEAVVYPSTSSMQAAEQYYQTAGKQLSLIPYGPDAHFQANFDELQLQRFRQQHSNGQRYILYVGARWAHKNFVGLLAAVAGSKALADWPILAVGGGAASHQERAIVRGLGLAGRVFFAERLSEEDLVLAYNAAAAFVMPSLDEGYGFPLAEAMACSIPTAAARSGSLPEVGADVPFWFDASNSNDMAEAIVQALNCKRDSARVQSGWQRYQSFKWADVAEQYIQVYRQLLGSQTQS